MVEYKYDAWGTPLSVEGSLRGSLGEINPFRYRGYVYDEETGLYYLRERFYQPTIQHFLNCDQIITCMLSDNSIYAYCKNNPIAFVDEDGQGGNHYQYHAEVQAAIVNQCRLMGVDMRSEYTIRSVPRSRASLDDTYTARVDLFMPQTGEIWEVKKATLSLSYAVDQVKRYELGRPVSFNIKLTAGKEYFEGVIEKPDHYIQYWPMGQGVIMYSVTLLSEGLPVPISERQRKRVNNNYANRKISVPIPIIPVPKKPKLTFSGGGNSIPWNLIGVGLAIGFGGGGARLCEIAR